MENIAYSLGIAFVVLAFIIGLIGTIAPVIPGLLLIWLGALVYAWIVIGFDVFSPWVFVLITLVGLIAGTSNLWLAALGAKTTGAPWRTLVVGFIGGIAGTFLIPIPILGTILGYAGGLVLSEYVRQGQIRPALRTAFGGVAGWGISTAVELAGGIIMILLVATQVP
jgi:uncharacterized protein YqgC (DUF456 family)